MLYLADKNEESAPVKKSRRGVKFNAPDGSPGEGKFR